MSDHGRRAGDIALEVRNLTKTFHDFDRSWSGIVRQALGFWRSNRNHACSTVVHDVSFTIPRGQVVGLVGSNGAGKTTLLKMIAGMLPIDSGTVTVNGRLTTLLAFGVGVHPEFSGRENIYYTGILMGMAPKEIAQRIDSIIEFAELSEVIDHPFRTYSSGMRARLLFSISMSVDPDIIIVDEALATGDTYFVQKCQRRIKQICDSGATVILVTHNLNQTQELCDRLLVMDRGRLAFDGEPRAGVDHYIGLLCRRRTEQLDQENAEFKTHSSEPPESLAVVREAYLLSEGLRTSGVVIGKPCALCVDVEFRDDLPHATIHADLHSVKCHSIYAFLQMIDMSSTETRLTPLGLSKGRWHVEFDLGDIAIGDGDYEVTIKVMSSRPEDIVDSKPPYCVYPRYLRFHAFYADPHAYGRGTMCEVPVRAVSVTPGNGGTETQDALRGTTA
jgi:ABC-type polysaccharide/polyol phosphate transport system ATPase subunit